MEIPHHLRGPTTRYVNQPAGRLHRIADTTTDALGSCRNRIFSMRSSASACRLRAFISASCSLAVCTSAWAAFSRNCSVPTFSLAISLFDSSRKSLSTWPSRLAIQSSPRTPTTTMNPPNSCSGSLCVCSTTKTAWDRMPRKLAASGTNSIASPPTTIALKNRFQKDRRSDQRSNSFLIASFGIPFRRRRSLGRIEIGITIGVWIGCALAVWIILRWF